jgi:acyl-coenzyme A synthetase/AMP-(fatty) acid ligase/thioesterase domain-containing protein/acyl carrier protein
MSQPTLPGIAAVAQQDPGRVALDLPGRAVTYGQLDVGADRLARRLLAETQPPGRRSLADGKHVAVPLLIAGAEELLVAVEAVRRAGMVTVPVDPNTPAPRLASIVREVSAELVVSDLDADLAGAERIDPLAGGVESGAPVDEPAAEVASITFTSGSTGEPKGVVKARAQRNAMAEFFRQRYGEGPLRVGTVLAGSIGASISVVTLFVDSGWTLVPYEISRQETSLGAWLMDAGLDVLIAVPTILRRILASLPGPGRIPGLRCVGLFGEGLLWDDVAALRDRLEPDGIVFNCYGSSEGGQVALFVAGPQTPMGTGRVPVGSPLADTLVRVVDEAGLEVEPGRIGEIVVSSPETATGYWHDEPATARVFTAGPDGRTLVHTGDAGVVNQQGELELRGRLDQMVKISGNRVDLGEIEAALRQYHYVTDAVATTYTNDAGELRLHAFVVTEPSRLVNGRALRGWLRQRLPRSALPDVVQRIDELPRLGTGKVDRAALPSPRAPVAQPAASTEVPAVRELLPRILELWREVLGTADIDPDDDFFDIGGDSLRAVALAGAVSDTMGADIPLWTVLETPTPRLMAVALAEGRSHERVVTMRRDGAGLPVFVTHDIAGNLFASRHYLSALDLDQPTLGFRPRAWDTEPVWEGSLEEMAGHYADDVGTAVPLGAVCLYGQGTGSPIAFEVARQLERRGRSVALLVVGSSPAPPRPTWMAVQGRARELAGTPPRQLSVEARDLAASSARRLASAARRRLGERRGTDPAQPARHALAARGAPVASQEAVTHYSQLVRNYRPSGRYRGPTLVVVPPWAPAEQGPDWTEWISGPVRVVDPDTLARQLDACPTRTLERLAP